MANAAMRPMPDAEFSAFWDKRRCTARAVSYESRLGFTAIDVDTCESHGAFSQHCPSRVIADVGVRHIAEVTMAGRLEHRLDYEGQLYRLLIASQSIVGC